MNVTIYNGVWNKDPHILPIQTLIKRIKNGVPKTVDKVNQIRSLIANGATKKEINAIKYTLPGYRVSGEFMYPEDSGLVTHSGLIVLDFDELQLGGLTPYEFKEKLKQLPFVYIAFISPSENGVKVIVKIPPKKEGHRGHFLGLADFFTKDGWSGVDPSGINESRLCFESYDPDLYINEDAVIWEHFLYEKEKDVARPSLIAPTGGGNWSDYKAIQRVVELIRNAQVGSRHNTVLKAGMLCGGFMASGKILEKDLYLIENAVITLFDGEDYKIELRALHDSILSGKEKPIYDAEPEVAEKNPTNNAVIRLMDNWGEMKRQYYEGKERGTTTFFPTLDPHFTFKKKELTIVSGMGNSGKTTFVMQLYLIQSVMVGTKWAIFSPENYPSIEFYDTLIEMLIGKSVDPESKKYGNFATLEEYEVAAKFINEHFFFIYPETAHTVEELEANFLYCIKEFGVGGVILDPFNQLTHQYDGRDDIYIGNFLAIRTRFARENNIYYHIITHPKSVRVDKDGEYPVIHFMDLSGGAIWSAKVDNFLSGRRPKQKSAPEDTTFEIHSLKIKKQKLVGIPGVTIFNYDRKSSRYFDEFGFNPLEQAWNIMYGSSKEEQTVKVITPSEAIASFESERKVDYQIPNEVIDGEPW